MPRNPISKDTVIQLRERNVAMLQHDLTLRNPLRLLKNTRKGLLAPGHFGAILSRSGGGKTALMIQVAMNAILQRKNVLHISLNDPVDKVILWFREVFRQMTHDNDGNQSSLLWDILLPHRLIMTFRAQGFSVEVLEERLKDLSEQGIFLPDLLVIDGIPFVESSHRMLGELKKMTERQGLHAWFTVTTHRHEPLPENDFPIQINPVCDLFEIILQLKSGKSSVKIHLLKGPAGTPPKMDLVLDPTSLLIQNSDVAPAEG